jgi:outer membrane protein TolC
MPLFTGGALEEQIAIDSLATQMGESKQKLSREELIYNVRSLYLSGLSLQELLTSQENYVQALNALKETISYQVELGKRAKIDLLKANNDLTQAIGKVALTQSALRKIKATLTALTHSSVENLEPLDVQVNKENALLNEQNLESLERFRLQELEIAKSSKMIRKVESLKKPQVGLNAYAGYNYDLDQLSHFENEQIWQVGLNVKWNIFDFGATSAKVQQAKIAKLQAIAQKESINEGFQKLFAQAKNQIETAQANYQTNASQYTLLEESQNIEQARYDAGVATLNDLLLAKSKTELAEVQMIQSKYAYQNGIFYLDYLLERGAK